MLARGVVSSKLLQHFLASSNISLALKGRGVRVCCATVQFCDLTLPAIDKAIMNGIIINSDGQDVFLTFSGLKML